MDLYGVANISQSTEIKELKKQTNRGVENPAQDPVVREKIRTTCLVLYGTDNASRSPGVQEKIRHTNLLRYGVTCVFQDPIIQEKIAQTLIIRYGVTNATQALEVQERIVRTNLARYGVERPLRFRASPELEFSSEVLYLRKRSHCLGARI
jgi:hypothetical protein